MLNIEPVLDDNEQDEQIPTNYRDSNYREDCTWRVWYQRNWHSSPVLKFEGSKRETIMYYELLIEAWG